MSQVLLVSFAGYPYSPSSLMPDNGLASLAGALLDAGHQVKVLDYGTVETLRRLFPEDLSRKVQPLARKLFVDGRSLGVLDKMRFLRAGNALDRFQSHELPRIAADVAAEAERFGAKFVGLKLWNGDGFAGAVHIARAVRQALPDAIVLGGGPHVDYFHGHILEYTDAFHFLVQGEGEQVLLQIIAAMEAGREYRDLPGVIWRDGGTVRSRPSGSLASLDYLPLPVYDPRIYPALRGDSKIRIGVLDESRGCPNRCAFCIHPIKSGGHWSLKGPQRVLSEMRRLMGALDSRYFVYSGSNTSARVAVSIAEEICRAGLDVRYGCFGHIRGIARADFDLLKQSGCEAIFYGLESASPRILQDSFNKPLDLELAETVLRSTREAGIATIASIIYPAPFEDEQSRDETLDFIRRVQPDSVPVTIPGIIPGTPWEKDPEKYGFAVDSREDFWDYALTYKIKLLFPPSLWKPLPYRVTLRFGGRDHLVRSEQLFQESERMTHAIEAMGIPGNLSHELVLMADALGRRDDLTSFRNDCRAMFLSGNADAVGEMTARINEQVRPSNSRAGHLAEAVR